MTRWRTFDVKVDEFDCIVCARSRGRAISSLWQRYADVRPGETFRQFRARAMVRPRREPIPDDGYDYVRRNYGLKVTLGQRVRLVNEGPSSGLEGVVLYPGLSTAHVHVGLDTEDRIARVHPMSIEAVDA